MSKAVFTALTANTGIAVAKAIAAVYTGSGSMLAESIHSAADCLNQILLLVGIQRAKKAPDTTHPMGYGRESYFWALLVAVLLFGLGGLFALVEGIHRLQHPEPVEHLGISIAILAGAVFLEGWSLLNAIKESEEERGGNSLLRWFRDTRQSELLIVTAEDIGALAGLAVALMALTLVAITGNPIFDAVGTFLVGILLSVISMMVLWEVRGLVAGESLATEERRRILAFVRARPEVDEVLNIITLQWGADKMVAVKAQMAPFATPEEMVAAINRVEEAMQDAFGIRWVFFEPDILLSEH